MTEPSVSADSDDVDRRARDFVKVAVLAGVVVVLVYLLAVQTSWGQTWDDSAVIERVKAGKKQIGRAKEVLETIRLPLLIAALALVVIIGVWRKKLRAGIAAVTVFAGTVLLAELMKILLPRPVLSDLESQVKFDGLNTFPSGTTTVATSLVLAIMLVCSARVRPWIAIVGVVWAATVAWGVLAAGWHRPSDAIGAVVLTTACFAGAMAWLLPRHWHSVAPSTLSKSVLPVSFLLLGVIAVAARAINWWVPRGGDWQLDSAAYVSASILILVSSCISILGFAWMMRSVDLR